MTSFGVMLRTNKEKTSAPHVSFFFFSLPLTKIFTIPSLRFLVQFKQEKVCVKFIQGSQKNGNIPTCKRKNNRLLEVAVP